MQVLNGLSNSAPFDGMLICFKNTSFYHTRRWALESLWKSTSAILLVDLSQILGQDSCMHVCDTAGETDGKEGITGVIKHLLL